MENLRTKGFVALLVAINSLLCYGYSAFAQNPEEIQLPDFVISPEKINVYHIKDYSPFGGNESEFTFTSISPVPSGFDFSESGELAWFPTPGEYEELSKSSVRVLFEAESKSDGAIVKGELEVKANSPQVAVSPAQSATTEIKVSSAKALATDTLDIKPPTFKGWNEKKEGEAFSFKLSATGGVGDYVFSVKTVEKTNYTFEENGYFYWEPGYEYVTGDNTLRGARFKFLVRDAAGKTDSVSAELIVHNANRAPVVNELPTFYVQWDKENTFQLKLDGIIYDEDKDPIVFKPVLSEMPQGMTLSKEGELKWKPSVRQFNLLRREGLKVTFIVEDIPFGDKTTGIARFEVTQQDLPPQITMVPDKEFIEINENESLNIGFFLNDPNGEEDIAVFDFVSDNTSVDKGSLKLIGNMQYEFKWTPDYSFVQEKGKSEEFSITFYAFDKENNRTEKQLTVKVNDSENIHEMDRIAYFQYRTVLATAFELVEQLSEKEDELKKEYRKAKNGKRKRAATNASLGAITGLSPVFLEGQPQKVTVGIGGTATATLGTLEASNVIGNPPSDVMQKWTYVTSKKNEILIHGNIFAGKYVQKEERRKNTFQNDLKNLTLQMNLQDMTKLELDASWQVSKDANDKNIKRVFKDFYPDEEYPVD